MNKTLAYVFKNNLGDCTGHGLSSKVDAGYIFWNCETKEAIDWCKENNVDPNKQFYLVERKLWGEDHSYAEPLIKPENKNQMFGGNFLYTSVSNFYKMDNRMTSVPIFIHDRFEDWQ